MLKLTPRGFSALTVLLSSDFQCSGPDWLSSQVQELWGEPEGLSHLGKVESHPADVCGWEHPEHRG